MSQKVNVSVFVPDNTVTSMSDELADGSVQRAVDTAKAAYLSVDSDGQIPVQTYDEDFDNAVEAATKYAETTDGADLIVIVTDLESNDRAKAERLLRGSDDMFVIVPVSNQGYDQAWADKLDADQEGPNNVDVIDPEELTDNATAMAEVGPWLNRVAV